MPDPRRKTLLGAADTYPRSGAPENRLTEIFAEVLRTSPQLTAWLVERQLPELVNTVNGGGYRVTTQFSLDGGSQRPDMQIDLNGQYVYVENKLDAGLTAAQTAGYTAVKDPHVLMAIVRAGSDSEFRRLQDRLPS